MGLVRERPMVIFPPSRNSHPSVGIARAGPCARFGQSIHIGGKRALSALRATIAGTGLMMVLVVGIGQVTPPDSAGPPDAPVLSSGTTAAEDPDRVIRSIQQVDTILDGPFTAEFHVVIARSPIEVQNRDAASS